MISVYMVIPLQRNTVPAPEPQPCILCSVVTFVATNEQYDLRWLLLFANSWNILLSVILTENLKDELPLIKYLTQPKQMHGNSLCMYLYHLSMKGY